MTIVRRITELKLANISFTIQLFDGHQYAVPSGGSVEIDVSGPTGDSVTVLNPFDNREYRIPVAAISGVSLSGQP
jgi:hypothetical protein